MVQLDRDNHTLLGHVMTLQQTNSISIGDSEMTLLHNPEGTSITPS